MKTIRTFIAAELDTPVREGLLRIQEDLKTCGADVKWTAPGQMHLTLKFLGETLVKKIAPLTESLSDHLRDIPAFAVSVTHLGGFPDIRAPRIIWAGFDAAGAQKAAELACAVETSVNLVGIPKEKRPYTAHLTLGRSRSATGNKELSAKLGTLTLTPPLSQTFRSVHFIQSTLTPSGPRYEILASFSLK